MQLTDSGIVRWRLPIFRELAILDEAHEAVLIKCVNDRTQTEQGNYGEP